SEVYIYVDDGKFTGWNRLECWRAVQRFSKVLSWLGIQDAFRKRTGPSTEPGPWAGTVTHTENGVNATVTELKWAKTQEKVQEMAQMLEEDETALPRKALEKARGFLIYVGRTYRWMNPYLKGLHLTIDGWRPDRDEEGYRIKEKRNRGREIEDELRWKEEEEAFERGEREDPKKLEEGEEDQEAPETVRAAPRFRSDIDALLQLTAGEEPAIQRCRVEGSMTAVYLGGDASGKGFGAAMWDDEEVVYSAGSWNATHSQESSNWREATNLTLKVEELAAEGRLDGKELWIFTDNSTYESAFYKGYSKESSKLTGIIFRLRKVERDTGCILHVIHIAGTRMKEAGIDGLSRQDFVEGIMGGTNPWQYFPLNEDADSRSVGRVMKWVEMWWYDDEGEPWTAPRPRGDDDQEWRAFWSRGRGNRWESELLVKLDPGDWFRLQEIKGHRLWIPPPAAMETVMELFAEDHLVNPHLAHVFIVPRLMTHLWRITALGLSETGPTRDRLLSCWTPSIGDQSSMDEMNFLTWRGKCLGCKKMITDGRGIFCANFFTSKGPFPRCHVVYHGACYRDYEGSPFPVQRTLDEDEEEEERGFEVDEEARKVFMHGRDGDHVMGVCFECDVCHFRNIMRRDVCWVSEKDLTKLRFIRRASLDVMWSRQTSTVHANFARMRRDVREAAEVMTMGHIFPRMGNPDMEDKCGMEIATIMLQASLRRGMYASHLQFDTTRKTVSWAMNAWSAVMRGEDGTLFASDDRTLFSSESPTRSRWFQRFVLGMKRRMGVIRKQDEALTSAQILALQEVGEWMWERAEGAAERKEIANIMAFVVIGFCASLRGEEISLVSMRGLLAFWQDTIQKGFIMVTLRGRFKGEDNLKWHLSPIVDITSSGIK
ncbi:hypothetical protein ACHAWT_000141, partial [Skeletonema menzelii]